MLITLAIIGVVAAMTIPTMIQGYKKKVVETRLQKFHATFQQVFRLSEIEHGNLAGTVVTGSNMTIENVEAWQDKYVRPYVKYSKSETTYVGTFLRTIYHLIDGSVAIVPATSTTVLFYPFAQDFYLSNVGTEEAPEYYPDTKDSGIKWFTFTLDPTRTTDKNRIFHPYYSMTIWDGTIDMLKNAPDIGCNTTAWERAYCTEWIEMNGWKIPEDYPFKF